MSYDYLASLNQGCSSICSHVSLASGLYFSIPLINPLRLSDTCTGKLNDMLTIFLCNSLSSFPKVRLSTYL
jgi:hypothetical protein